VLLDDGRIIIAGSVCSLPIATEVCGIGIARLLADGTSDATFGSGGKSITPLGADGGFAFDIAQGSHGTLIVAGTQQFGTAGGTVPATSSVALVARFLSNGTLDATFGSSGFSESSYAHTFASLGDVRIARDGNIYASGIVTEATGVPPDFSALSIARYQN
jgi:hypothetical protein